MNDEARQRLRKAYRRMTWPSLAANGAGAALATLYSFLTFQMPPGLAPQLASLSAVVSAVVIAVVGLLAARLLRTRDAVGGAADARVERLQRAVRRVVAFPDRVFLLSLLGWVIAVGGIGIGSNVLSGEAGLGALPRVALVGVLCGPISAMLAHLLAVIRSRDCLLALAEIGLTPEQVLEAAPPRRTQLRVRLVVFTAICVLTPAVLTADLTSTLSRRTVDQVARISEPTAQRAAAAELRAQAVVRVAGMGLLVLALALLTAYVGGTAIGGPMRDIADQATRLANGTLDAPRVIPAEDEVWAVSAAFTSMHGHLSAVLSELKRAGVQIGSTTDEIVTTSSRYEEGAAEQATALNQTSATTEELARSARQIAENASSMAEIAQKTLAAAEAGQHSADAFAQSMDRMQQDNRAIAESVTKLNKRIVQIGRIVEFINGVADKSDLLALNAELEGTKAGDVGRGFSLVAAEMRRLAENVLESTKEIEGLIAEIREATQAAVAATEAGVRATDSGGALAQEVSQSLQEIVELAGQTFDAVRSISLATQQQQTGTDQLAEAMADILRVTQQSLAATKQVSAANVDLTSLWQDLRAVVSRFDVAQADEGRR